MILLYLWPMYHCSWKNDSAWKRSGGPVNIMLSKFVISFSIDHKCWCDFLINIFFVIVYKENLTIHLVSTKHKKVDSRLKLFAIVSLFFGNLLINLINDSLEVQSINCLWNYPSKTYNVCIRRSTPSGWNSVPDTKKNQAHITIRPIHY